MSFNDWQGPDGALGQVVSAQSERVLETYRADPNRLEEDSNIERSISEGGYSNRQVFELVQNAADAMRSVEGRCKILLTDHTLYVANQGEPFTERGVEAVMAAYMSAKRDDQIGRFGLGFKSVLSVSDSPMVYSRTGSFAFDAGWSKQLLSREFPDRDHYPTLRLARALDPNEAFVKDRELEDLARWAQTVVVIPIRENREALARSISIFPKEFLLFSPHVAQLDLEIPGQGGLNKRFTVSRAGQEWNLSENGDSSRWVVSTKRHTPSREAMVDGGYHAARESVDVSWAAPIDGPMGLGRFWAYFPLNDLTTLSGILNAPWKLADDRETLLDGAFNQELLTQVVPQLVVDALRHLAPADKPATVIDALPARGKESRSLGDQALNIPVIKAVAQAACIPNGLGDLCKPRGVSLHPDNVTSEDLELWAKVARNPERWVHPTIFSAERRAKVLRLMNLHGREPATEKEWVESLVRGSQDVETSGAAVQLVASLIRRKPELEEELRSARVLRLEDGSLAPCRSGETFVRGETAHEGRLFIDPQLLADPNVERALSALGIEVYDEAGELRAELSVAQPDWMRVWRSARKVSLTEAKSIFMDVFGENLLEEIRVRNAEGGFSKPGQVLLPGRVIPGDTVHDRRWVVDQRFHAQDLELLRSLGLVDAPVESFTPRREPWRHVAEQELRDWFRRKEGSSRIQDRSIRVSFGREIWPLEFLPDLSPKARAAVTSSVLFGMVGAEDTTVSRRNGTARRPILSPIWSRLRRYGVLETAAGLQPVARCLVFDEANAVLGGVVQPLPYVQESLPDEAVRKLSLKESPDLLDERDWASLIDAAGAWELERRTLLYAWAAYYEQTAPASIKVARGPGHVTVAPRDAAVTASKAVFDSLVIAGVPALLASEHDTETLQEVWGLAVGEQMLQETIEREVSGEPALVVDRFPPLRNTLALGWHDLKVQPCTTLARLTSTPRGQVTTSLQFVLEDRTVYTTATSDLDVLRAVGEALGADLQPSRVLTQMERQRQSRFLQQVRETETVEEKLLVALGVKALRESIPQPALDALQVEMGRNLADDEISRLALAVDGYGVLKNHKKGLEKAKLQPPQQWAGSRAARDWVKDLGFPVEYAGLSGESRAAEMEVEGPPKLGRLHEYQRTIGDRIQRLLRPDAERNRGLVALPTGAGKTRVAVQALVEWMVEQGEPARVVWIAETDELCEQATQSWASIWRSFGDGDRPLTLSRLWGQNEATERDGFQVVVASTAKLTAKIEKVQRATLHQQYAWLAHPTMIVIDEAHRSITSAYNDIVRALGQVPQPRDLRVPLLGLTATPFRGFNTSETGRLADRYYNNLLDAGVFPDDDTHGHLQQLGVLAKVRQLTLEGAQIELSSRELQDVEEYHRLPESVEKRIGLDDRRNSRIVQSIRNLSSDMSVLLFASSVENARTLSALLSFHGIEARAVAGDTDRFVRRKYVEDFKTKKVRVLTNYNVFTEGFDVPKVDAVYLTRPVFSPNVYQQMIGRGLRGPLNGGNEEVTVVNVEDNLTNYGEEFAFRHFQHLWGAGAYA